MVQQTTYPLLKWKDIISSLEKYVPELKIKQGDYNDPNGDFWVKVYQILLPRILDLSYEELFPQNQNHFPYGMSEYFNKSFVTKYIVKHMNQAKHICKFKDFFFTDCIFPDKTRLQDILSACINYIIFKESKKKIIDDIIIGKESKMKELSILKINNAEMSKTIENIVSSAKENNMENIKKEIDNVAKDLENIVKQVAILKKEDLENKAEIKKVTIEKDRKKSVIEELTKKSKELDDLICLNPTQWLDEIKELKIKNDLLESEMSESTNMLFELERVLRVYTELNKLMQQILSSQNLCKETATKIKNCQDKLQLTEKGAIESCLDCMEAELHNKKLIKKEHLLNIKSYESVKKEFDETLLMISQSKKKLSELENEKLFLNEYMKQLKENHDKDYDAREQKLDACVAQQEEILQKFEEKKELINKALAKLAKDIEDL